MISLICDFFIVLDGLPADISVEESTDDVLETNTSGDVVAKERQGIHP